MRNIAGAALVLLSLGSTIVEASARCSRFIASTMYDTGFTPVATWRLDYPSSSSGSTQPWRKYEFDKDPMGYMNAILSTVRPYLKYDGTRLVGTGTEPWWLGEWMDYDKRGREPMMGLTKERKAMAGDFSATSQEGAQVWAVNLYNEAGAVTLGQVFADPCSPNVPAKVLFLEGTVAIKFLFTDADLGRYAGEVAYLDGAPTYQALIDAEGVGDASDTRRRVVRDLNLLQLDIGVKDDRATKTGWVFGTYVWMGPMTGDGLYDNLVPTALMWANDEGNITDKIADSWINTDSQLYMKTYGWTERPYLGFMGRANGPADNILSSCLSCHATARTPESSLSLGAIGKDFQLGDFQDPKKVKPRIDTWFKNLQPGDVFDAGGKVPAVATLDYSLQLKEAIKRMCTACKSGALDGPTPAICISANYYKATTCKPASLAAVLAAQQDETSEPLPRQ